MSSEAITRNDLKAILEGLGLSPSAYIVESGTSGFWTYRKWSDGTAECWGWSDLGNITISNTYGSEYYAYASAISYPVAYTSAPTLIVTAHSTGGRVWASPDPHSSASQTPRITIFAPVSLTDQRVYLCMHALGKWK